ncbi:MAG: hypothetical protein H6738_03260 [Alphaproteobacteria bacterium]|nr:hypothetical protein [Alphaproteobacteria bacterium]MCB9695788.1 hypothetical protein [Alphaproteobacteria bacterium]
MKPPSRSPLGPLVLLTTLFVSGCPVTEDEVRWELVWPSGDDPQLFTRGATHPLELRTQPYPDLEGPRFCYAAAGVVDEVCFDLPESVRHEPTVVTADVQVRGDAPLGTFELVAVTDLAGVDEGSIKGRVVDDGTPTGGTTPTAPPASIACTPGLWTTGTATVHFETGSVLGQAVTFDLTTGGVNGPPSVTVPAGDTGADISVTPNGEGFVWVQLIGGEQTFLLEDMRLYGKSEPTLGHHTGSSFSFTRFLPIAADLTYSREETSGLFGATNQLLVQGTFTYDGQAFTLDEYIGSDGEDTLVIPFGTDRLLLTHVFGGPGSVTLSFNRVDQSYVNTDSGSFEILHD